MTTIAEQFGTTYFQLSPVGVGALAVGIEDIRLRISNVLNTIPGTDPFRPFFGSFVYLFSDAPLPLAIPNIKKEFFTALRLWMPEITVISIIHKINGDSQLEFDITYNLVDDDLTDTITFINGAVEGATTANSVIITALVPAKFTNGIYRVAFTINNTLPYPSPPVQGWLTPDDMLAWINTNWGRYGRWYLTGTSLVVYLNTAIAQTAELTVTEKASLTLSARIPELTAGQVYHLAFTANASAALPAFASGLNNPAALLGWVTANWGNYGNWYLLNNGATVSLGDFGSDFGPDFDTGGIITNIDLVFQTDSLVAATLTFT